MTSIPTLSRRDAGPGVPGRAGRLVRGHRHPGVRLPPPGPGPDRRRAGPPGPPRAERADPRRTRRATGPGGNPRSTPAGCAGPRLIETAEAGAPRCRTPTAAVPWYEPGRRYRHGPMRRTASRLHPYAMARYDRLRSDGLEPGEAMQEAAPLFARHPYARDAPSVPRLMLEAAAPGQTDGPAAGTSAGPVPAEGTRAGGVRPCDEDFPLPIRDVLAARSRNGRLPCDRGASHAGRTAPFPAGPRP